MANTGVMVELGGQPRRLRFDVNVVCDFEQVSGVTIQQLPYRSGLNVSRALLWAGLKAESPELTLARVGQWMQELSDDAGGAMEAGEALAAKISEALIMAGVLKPPDPEPKEGDDAAGDDAQGEAAAKAD